MVRICRKQEIKAGLEPCHGVCFFVFVLFSGERTSDYDGTCTHLLEGRVANLERL